MSTEILDLRGMGCNLRRAKGRTKHKKNKSRNIEISLNHGIKGPDYKGYTLTVHTSME